MEFYHIYINQEKLVMTKLKTNTLKAINKILLLAIAILGFGCEEEPMCEYGTPHAKFKLKGVIRNESTLTGIPGIKVTLTNNFNKKIVVTDKTGAFEEMLSVFPDDTVKFHLEIRDIDSEKNGLYEDADLDIRYIKPKYKNGSGNWYRGEVEKELDIKLKESSNE